MSITGHRQWEQEYCYLSYFHHVVLGLDEVDRLVHTVTEELDTQIQPPCRPPGVVTEPGVIHSSPPCRALDRFSQSKHMPVSCPVTKEEREFGSFQRPNGRWGVTRWSLIRPDFQTAGPLPLGRRRSALVQRWEGFR